ncbi:MAG: pyridoxamine 5'-phosphate oxidase family protein [Acidimicrobiales bacterium]|jgi:nitroimidazol reductase NimA-like FMN-containing flavoprotein (pyridoxamine 5'-phosphate oxidase superfamily)
MGGLRRIELSRNECLRLLATSPIGRVGLSVEALPAVLPVNFAVFDGDVVFRTAEGTKLHAAMAGRVLAFEADGYSTDGLSGWSVLVQGVARLVTEPTELQRALQLTVEPWAVEGAADQIVRITSTMISGRLFQRIPQ